MKSFLSDPVLLILLFATFVFTGLLLFVSFRQPTDGQTFQVMSGLATGFAGAVLARVKPQAHTEPLPEPTEIHVKKTTTTETESLHGPEPKVD
jgi:hypothetical protein